jgi:hypothetical protein
VTFGLYVAFWREEFMISYLIPIPGQFSFTGKKNDRHSIY